MKKIAKKYIIRFMVYFWNIDHKHDDFKSLYRICDLKYKLVNYCMQ